jgi:VIT1/CCC1 family predicted Fe2+/Mn2+ transporter
MTTEVNQTPHSETQIHQIGNSGTSLKDYIGEFVYGGIDGSVTTFAVVAGSTGASLETSVILILGFANLIADGFSMSVGDFFSTKANIDNYKKHRNIEYWEVDNMPDAEKEEIREIYRQKGLEGETLENVVDVITSDKDRWVDVMMKEELEMQQESRSPVSTAAVTFGSFVLVGFIPLFSYVLDYAMGIGSENMFLTSSIMTGIAFGLIGLLKSYVTETRMIRSVIETLLLGGLAAIIAYYVGDVLEVILTS